MELQNITNKIASLSNNELFVLTDIIYAEIKIRIKNDINKHKIEDFIDYLFNIRETLKNDEKMNLTRMINYVVKNSKYNHNIKYIEDINNTNLYGVGKNTYKLFIYYRNIYLQNYIKYNEC